MTHYDFAVRLHGKIALQTAFAYAGWDTPCLQTNTFGCKNQNTAAGGAHRCKKSPRGLGASGACAKISKAAADKAAAWPFL